MSKQNNCRGYIHHIVLRESSCGREQTTHCLKFTWACVKTRGPPTGVDFNHVEKGNVGPAFVNGSSILEGLIPISRSCDCFGIFYFRNCSHRKQWNTMSKQYDTTLCHKRGSKGLVVRLEVDHVKLNQVQHSPRKGRATLPRCAHGRPTVHPLASQLQLMQRGEMGFHLAEGWRCRGLATL